MIQNSRRSLYLIDSERDVLMENVNDYFYEVLPPVDSRDHEVDENALGHSDLEDYSRSGEGNSYLDFLVNQTIGGTMALSNPHPAITQYVARNW